MYGEQQAAGDSVLNVRKSDAAEIQAPFPPHYEKYDYNDQQQHPGAHIRDDAEGLGYEGAARVEQSGSKLQQKIEEMSRRSYRRQGNTRAERGAYAYAASENVNSPGNPSVAPLADQNPAQAYSQLPLPPGRRYGQQPQPQQQPQLQQQQQSQQQRDRDELLQRRRHQQQQQQYACDEDGRPVLNLDPRHLGPPIVVHEHQPWRPANGEGVNETRAKMEAAYRKLEASSAAAAAAATAAASARAPATPADQPRGAYYGSSASSSSSSSSSWTPQAPAERAPQPQPQPLPQPHPRPQAYPHSSSQEKARAASAAHMASRPPVPNSKMPPSLAVNFYTRQSPPDLPGGGAGQQPRAPSGGSHGSRESSPSSSGSGRAALYGEQQVVSGGGPSAFQRYPRGAPVHGELHGGGGGADFMAAQVQYGQLGGGDMRPEARGRDAPPESSHTWRDESTGYYYASAQGSAPPEAPAAAPPLPHQPHAWQAQSNAPQPQAQRQAQPQTQAQPPQPTHRGRTASTDTSNDLAIAQAVQEELLAAESGRQSQGLPYGGGGGGGSAGGYRAAPDSFASAPATPPPPYQPRFATHSPPPQYYGAPQGEGAQYGNAGYGAPPGAGSGSISGGWSEQAAAAAAGGGGPPLPGAGYRAGAPLPVNDVEEDRRLALQLEMEENGGPMVDVVHVVAKDDSEVKRRLSRMSSIPHEMRTNSGRLPTPDHATSDHQRLMDRLYLYGLRERQISGDGNCQFRALADQLFASADKHAYVRKCVVHQLKNSPDLYEAHIPDKFSDYVKKMSKSGEWGDHVTLQAAADYWGVKICLLTTFKDNYLIEIMPRKKVPKADIWLSFWAEVHYNSIHAIEDLPADIDVKKKKHWLF
eukprot:jgi/Mesen1/8257/ME000445S07410